MTLRVRAPLGRAHRRAASAARYATARTIAAARAAVTPVLFVGGFAAIVTGVALVAVPAALIVAGAGVMFAAVRLATTEEGTR